jgi:hypothetical protein
MGEAALVVGAVAGRTVLVDGSIGGGAELGDDVVLVDGIEGRVSTAVGGDASPEDPHDTITAMAARPTAAERMATTARA